MNSRKRTNLGFAVACILILVMGLISNISTSTLIRSNELVKHTQDVRKELEELSSVFLNAQTNIRAFLLAKDQYYIDLFNEAKTHIAPSLEKLNHLTKDDPEQTKDLAIVKRMLEERIEVWKKIILIRQTRTVDEVLKISGSDSIKIKTAQMQDIINRMKVRQELSLKTLVENSKASGERALWIVTLGGIFAVGFIILAAFIVDRDIRRRIIAEDERDRFFTVSLDMLCISDMDGYFKKLSPAFESVLGYSLDELYSRPILDFIHPDDLEITINEIKKQIGGTPVLAFENRYVCKDGSAVNLSWKSVPIGNRMYGVARDVTAQKEFEKVLMKAQADASLASKVKSEFLANMSHEIRTPLNGVIGATDLVLETKLDGEQERLIRVIKNSSLMLLKIINEILDFSKIEAGKLELEYIDFDMSYLIDGQKSLVGQIARDKDLTFTSSIDPLLPATLNGDSGRLGQVILNLLNNAIKFTDTGAITLTAKLQQHQNDTYWVHFSIEDTGIGMSHEQTQKLFSPFVQADGSTARKYGGTGLGLSISKKLTELMGGEIGVTSVVGKGSTFWFTVPLKPVHKKEITSPLDNQEMLVNLERKIIRVLVAEDNPVNQMIVMKMLEKLKCTVHLVGNGLEAVEAFSKNDFDIILMDHHMPEMDGMEATTIIRTKEKEMSRRTPILAFTANVMEDDQKLCLAAGMDDFIHKPVTLTVLEKSLYKWLKETV